MCLAHSVLLHFLPPYSPDFIPIEPSFHLLKAWMKRYRDLAPTYGEDDYEKKFENFLALAVREWGYGQDHKNVFRKALISVD